MHRDEQGELLRGWFLRNWELVLYGLIFLAAVFSRFYDLGARGISHDESLHMLYSYKLFAGEGYRHDPMMHGPFLFHLNAFLYFLFGDTNYIARSGAAIFGVILVILPFWLRPWLGRIGALLASVFLLISPVVTHYSRHLRHDVFNQTFTLVMYISLFQFLGASRQGDDKRRWRWLYIGAAAVSLMLCTKELAFIHGFIGLVFILLVILAEQLDAHLRRRVFWVSLVVMIAVGLSAFYLAAGSASPAPAGGTANLAQKIVQGMSNFLAPPVAGTESSPGANSGTVWQLIQILVLGAGLFFAAGTVLVNVGSVVAPQGKGARSDRLTMLDAIRSIPLDRLAAAVVIAVALFAVFYTTFFTNLYGLVSGTWGAVSYWLSQHGVQRGSQPWYYYLMLLPLYEFLPLFVGFGGGFWFTLHQLGRAADKPQASPVREHDLEEVSTPSRDAFVAFLIFWAISAVFIYSWAGEKMPWLTVHLTVPFVLLAAWTVNKVLSRVDWRELWHRGGGALAALFTLFAAGLVALLSVQPFQGQSLFNLRDTGQWIGILVILIILGYGVAVFWRKVGTWMAWRTAFALLLVVLLLLTARSSWLVSFINYDNVSEYLFYAHGAPDLTVAMEQIEDLSRRTVGDKLIKVAYDNDSTWPLEWYFREYPNRAYYGDSPNREQLDAPIVIVGATNENEVTPFLGDKYQRFNYRLVWWPLEAYKGQTPSQIWHTYFVPDLSQAADAAGAWQQVKENRQELWNIIFYHQHKTPKNEWPFVHRFYMYVRKDVLNELWDYQVGPIAIQEVTATYAEGFRETRALRAVGNEGSAPGQFMTPRAVAVGPNGLWYVADSGNNRIQVLDETGNSIRQWGSVGTGDGQFQEPWGIAVGGDRVYVSDTWNHRIQVFDLEGNYITQWGRFSDTQGDAQKDPGAFWGPRDITVDATGHVYVCDTGNKRIQKFTPEGEFIAMWGGAGVIPGRFEEPTSIAIGPDGKIYVADTWNHRVQVFSPDFEPLLQWDIDGWESDSVVNKPYLRVDSQNNVFVGDPEKYRILVFDAQGDFLFTFGQYGFDTGAFALPLGMAFDAEDSLIVVDSDNNRLLKFPPVAE
jgi:uncharacterized protein (TIGR03663 family)